MAATDIGNCREQRCRIGVLRSVEHPLGRPDLDEAPVAAHLAGSEIAIRIVVGNGPGSATVWTCDLTHGYIDINADYRS